VQVILDRVLAQERKLQFALVEEELKLTDKKTAHSASKTKKEKRKNTVRNPANAGKRRSKKGRRR
jgi:ribonuclease R